MISLKWLLPIIFVSFLLGVTFVEWATKITIKKRRLPKYLEDLGFKLPDEAQDAKH